MVSERSYDGWHRFAFKHGVTVTGLLDVLGEHLAEGHGFPDDATLRELVERARMLDDERRHRRGRRLS